MDKNNIATVVPVPKSYKVKEGRLKLVPQIISEYSEWDLLANTFCECVIKIFGAEFTSGSKGVRLFYDADVKNEAYVLDVDEDVKIYASSYQGCAYALATVLQLLDNNLDIEKVRIEDEPDKDYRCLMIDVAREWHPFSTLLHYVDLCFFYKIKYLHVHFMDDQGYRLPSKVLPELPTKGRSYSFEEIKTLCKYANSRGVVIVPEIEMPGHARSLNDAYPDLFSNTTCMDADTCVDTTGETAIELLFDVKSTICVGSDKTFYNITKLIDEVLELFPHSPYIHLGGDEVNTSAWKNCSVCREYMSDHGLQDTQELFADFIARVTSYVMEKGRTPILWEGFSKKYANKISKDVIVIGWECCYQKPNELVESGFRVINSAWKPLYLVPGYTTWNVYDILHWNIYEWQHWYKLSEATLNPIHLTPTQQIIGAQLCAWEATYEWEIAGVINHLAALSERSWSIKRYCDDEEFKHKLMIQSKKAFHLIAEV